MKENLKEQSSLMEKLTSLCKRRGFIFQSSEIYGGIGGVYDFGPLGVELKNNLKKLWWKRFVLDRDDVVGMESAILMNRQVWQASGHEKDFIDELVECKKCHKRFRKDEIVNPKSEILNPKQISNLKSQIPKCSECGGMLTEPRQFNLMLKTFVGPVEDSASMTYLRPETAQGMFVNFKNILETSRKKIPFGIAQIGKSFRNEITPGNFLYRMREFEIAEIEYFVKSDEDKKWFDYWLSEWQKFFLDLGIKKSNLETHDHPKEELAHYSKRTVDLVYDFPFGRQELAGVANRTDYDLKRHQEFSGKNLAPTPPPYVIEPTLGIERTILAILLDAFEIVKGGRKEGEQRPKPEGQALPGRVNIEEIVLHLHPALAPVKVAVLPLVKKLSKEAQKVYQLLKPHFVCQYDEEGSIGRRYRRQDEIATPFCVTFDFETLKDKKVTVRNRDTMKQERVKISELNSYLSEKFS
jgi:glycyl-tRNA synthetase